MSKHTPTPWKIEKIGGTIRVTKAVYETGFNDDICGCGMLTNSEHYANAEFIVRACNSHDELLEACKEVVAQEDRKTGQNYLIHQQTMEKLKQIIQKAKDK